MLLQKHTYHISIVILLKLIIIQNTIAIFITNNSKYEGKFNANSKEGSIKQLSNNFVANIKCLNNLLM